MRNKVFTAILVLFAFSIVFPQAAAARDAAPSPRADETKQTFSRGARRQFFQKEPPGRRKQEKAVAWIVEGYEGCTVTRIENGILKQYDAEADMKLYPGDVLYKKDDIESVKFDFLSYAGIKIEDMNRLVIVFKPPENKEDIFIEIGNFLGLLKTKFKEIPGATRNLDRSGPDSLENATLIADRGICFGGFLQGKTIIFRELQGREVFRETFGKNPVLIPGKAGLVQGKAYIYEIRRGEKLHYRSLIRMLSKKDELAVKEALMRIDLEKISEDEKIVKKAAYLQLVSDLYPGQIDLYWLSYHLLNNADLKGDGAVDPGDVLWGRCSDHFSGGIIEADFTLLETPGCLVTIELKRKGEKGFVAPNFSFREEDAFRIHFQANFSGYVVILYEDEEKGGFDLVFPFEGGGYRVEPEVERYSVEYEFYGGPCEEKFIFIFSKNPIKEIEELYRSPGNQKEPVISDLNPQQKNLLGDLKKRVQKEGRELDVGFIGSKAFVRSSQKNLPCRGPNV